MPNVHIFTKYFSLGSFFDLYPIIRGILEGDEHFREFDPNVLQPVMDAQVRCIVVQKACMVCLWQKPAMIESMLLSRWRPRRRWKSDQRTPQCTGMAILEGMRCSTTSRGVLLVLSATQLVPSPLAAFEVCPTLSLASSFFFLGHKSLCEYGSLTNSEL